MSVDGSLNERENKMSEIIILSGSPSVNSKSDKILHYVGTLLEKQNISVTHISVLDIPAEILLYGKYDSSIIKEIAQKIQEAKGLIVGSPVYKAAYSGVLKALFDIMPQDILQDKTVLPLMTGGSPAHLLALEYALKPLLSTMKGQPLKGLYYIDSQIDKTKENPIIDEEILSRTHKQLDYFLGKIGVRDFGLLLRIDLNSPIIFGHFLFLNF